MTKNHLVRILYLSTNNLASADNLSASPVYPSTLVRIIVSEAPELSGVHSLINKCTGSLNSSVVLSSFINLNTKVALNNFYVVFPIFEKSIYTDAKFEKLEKCNKYYMCGEIKR